MLETELPERRIRPLVDRSRLRADAQIVRGERAVGRLEQEGLDGGEQQVRGGLFVPRVRRECEQVRISVIGDLEGQVFVQRRRCPDPAGTLPFCELAEALREAVFHTGVSRDLFIFLPNRNSRFE